MNGLNQTIIDPKLTNKRWLHRKSQLAIKMGIIAHGLYVILHIYEELLCKSKT